VVGDAAECDLCSSEEGPPVFLLPSGFVTWSLVHGRPGNERIRTETKFGRWRLCPTCNRLAREGNRRVLVTRAVEIMRSRYPEARTVKRKELEALFAPVHAAFFDVLTGGAS
jgi:hypothetical protein